MGLIEDVTDRHLGLPIGLGIAVAAVSAGPKLIKTVRPVAKSAIKGFLALQARAKETFAEMGEQMQDLMAEAKHEYEAAPQQASAEDSEKPARKPAARGKTTRSRKPTAKASTGAES